MKTKDMLALKPGDTVEHKQFGLCKVKEVIRNFGPTIIADTKAGRQLLSFLSGMPGTTPYLASDYKQNLKKP